MDEDNFDGILFFWDIENQTPVSPVIDGHDEATSQAGQLIVYHTCTHKASDDCVHRRPTLANQYIPGKYNYRQHIVKYN